MTQTEYMINTNYDNSSLLYCIKDNDEEVIPLCFDSFHDSSDLFMWNYICNLCTSRQIRLDKDKYTTTPTKIFNARL